MKLSFQNPKFIACVISETVPTECPSRTLMYKGSSMAGIICGSRSYRCGSSNSSDKFLVPFLYYDIMRIQDGTYCSTSVAKQRKGADKFKR